MPGNPRIRSVRHFLSGDSTWIFRVSRVEIIGKHVENIRFPSGFHGFYMFFGKGNSFFYCVSDKEVLLVILPVMIKCQISVV